MKVAIRADASVDLGIGHVMRCITLADVLCARGADVLFLSRDLPGHALIEARGHALQILPRSASWNMEIDAAACLEALPGRVDWLIVDHYGLARDWERAMRARADRLLVIDDLADRPHDCELLLDQNLQPEVHLRYGAWVSATCYCLLGPKYALLRPQFATARQALRERDGHVYRLLVFFGGTDAGRETLKALSAIEMLGRPDLAVDVVIGQANVHQAAIAAACRGRPNATLHCQVDDMAARMAAADLFVGAGGVSSWERCCLGLPALVLATADNQLIQSEVLARAGAQLYLGPAKSVTADRLTRLMEEVLNLPALLRHMASQGQGMVDGRGAERVANHLLAVELQLRRAQSVDSGAIFAWRNHPDTRRYALDAGDIDREAHERWFAAVREDRNHELLIAEREGQPVGVLRYDIEAGRGVVSIYLVPGLTGQGWGKRLLLAGERWLREERPDVRLCEAKIRAENAASLAVFQAVGYQPDLIMHRKKIYGAP